MGSVRSGRSYRILAIGLVELLLFISFARPDQIGYLQIGYLQLSLQQFRIPLHHRFVLSRS